MQGMSQKRHDAQLVESVLKGVVRFPIGRISRKHPQHRLHAEAAFESPRRTSGKMGRDGAVILAEAWMPKTPFL